MNDELIGLDQLIDYSQFNTGGTLSLYYAAIGSIFDFPEFLVSDAVTGFKFNDQIDFFSNHGWLRVPVVPHSKFGWNYSQKKSQQDPIYSVTCGGVLTQHSTALTRQLHLMAATQFVIRVKDKDGVEIVMGDLDTPFDFSFSFQSGENNRQLKGYTLKWTARFLAPPMGSPA